MIAKFMDDVSALPLDSMSDEDVQKKILAMRSVRCESGRVNTMAISSPFLLPWVPFPGLDLLSFLGYSRYFSESRERICALFCGTERGCVCTAYT